MKHRYTLAIWPLFWLFASLASATDLVTLEELPAPAFAATAGVSNIAADGTVVGTAWPDGVVVRWRPGQPPENLGGDTFTLENVMPLISANGSTIVTSHFYPFDENDPQAGSVGKASLWGGGTTWEPIESMLLEQSTPFAVSDNGTFVAGSGLADSNPPPNTVVHDWAWVWSAEAGLRLLGALERLPNTQAWGVSNDGRVAAGFADNSPDDSTRYGVIWTDNTPVLLQDAEQRPVGQAIGCNSDCSIVVGAGSTAATGSKQAWRWTAQTGVQYLGEAPTAPSGAHYYAFDTSEDGSTIVGSFVVFDPEQGPINHGFLWTENGGMTDIVYYLDLHGIDYGAGFNELVINSVTRDGRRLLLNGANADFQRQRAVVGLQTATIFANGFEAE
jgi:uncharacterized membrane protein